MGEFNAWIVHSILGKELRICDCNVSQAIPVAFVLVIDVVKLIHLAHPSLLFLKIRSFSILPLVEWDIPLVRDQEPSNI